MTAPTPTEGIEPTIERIAERVCREYLGRILGLVISKQRAPQEPAPVDESEAIRTAREEATAKNNAEWSEALLDDEVTSPKGPVDGAAFVRMIRLKRDAAVHQARVDVLRWVVALQDDSNVITAAAVYQRCGHEIDRLEREQAKTAGTKEGEDDVVPVDQRDVHSDVAGIRDMASSPVAPPPEPAKTGSNSVVASGIASEWPSVPPEPAQGEAPERISLWAWDAVVGVGRVDLQCRDDSKYVYVRADLLAKAEAYAKKCHDDVDLLVTAHVEDTRVKAEALRKGVEWKERAEAAEAIATLMNRVCEVLDSTEEGEFWGLDGAYRRCVDLKVGAAAKETKT